MGSQVGDTFRFGVRVILPGDVVGDEVDDGFQTVAVGAQDQVLKLLHAFGNVCGNVGIYVIIVFDGIRRTGFPFDDGGMVRADVVAAVVCLCGMFDDACIPDVGGA